MQQKNAPIGVFDSGLGGISVLKELVQLMPSENYLYFGDSANAPYGPRCAEEVQRLTCANAAMLVEKGCKALVIACNTATSAAIQVLRANYPQVPIVGIEPAVKPPVQELDHPNVLVMATEMTLREEKFRLLMKSYENQAAFYCLPAPGIVERVERGVVDGPEMDAYLNEILQPYQKMRIDAVVLGCTHFPFARDSIRRNMKQPVVLYDGGAGTARETARRLKEAGLETDRTGQGTVELTNSRGAEAVKISEMLLAM